MVTDSLERNITLERRALLAVDANPSRGREYLVTLRARLGEAEATLRYVPDRWILRRHAALAYFGGLGHAGDLEAAAWTILDDLNNELVPRWIQVQLTLYHEGSEHVVVLEDRQPKWDNKALLDRLEKL